VSTELILAWVAILISVVGVWVSVWAALDARKQVKRMIGLERKRVFTHVRNDMVWQFVDATPKSHTPEIAKGLEEFSLLSLELNRSHTPDLTTNAVNQESLKFADRLVKNGYAVWKSGWDMTKLQQELDKWQEANNKNLLTSIDPKLTKNSIV